MMMIKTIKSGKTHSFWLLLPVMLILLSGCSKESSEDPEPGSTYAPVKFSLDIVSPEMGSTLLASVADGGQINTRFYSRMNEGASKTILVRQDGKMINLASKKMSLVLHAFLNKRNTLKTAILKSILFLLGLVSGKRFSAKNYKMF